MIIRYWIDNKQQEATIPPDTTTIIINGDISIMYDTQHGIVDLDGNPIFLFA